MEGLAWVGVGLAVYAGCVTLVSARCQRVMNNVHIAVEVSGESIGRQTVEGQRRVRILMIQIGPQGLRWLWVKGRATHTQYLKAVFR